MSHLAIVLFTNTESDNVESGADNEDRMSSMVLARVFDPVRLEQLRRRRW